MTQNTAEQETNRRLERTIRGRDSLTICVLVYDDEDQQQDVSDGLKGMGYKPEAIHLGENEEKSTQALVNRLSSGDKGEPIEIKDVGRWPGGVEDFAEHLNRASGRLAEECGRPVLVWVTKDEANSFAIGDARMGTRHSGFYDFAAARAQDGARGAEGNSPKMEAEIGRDAKTPAAAPAPVAGSAAERGTHSRDTERPRA